MMNCDGGHCWGWYHNGSETRRFSDQLPSQKIAFHGLRNTLFRLIEHPIGHFKWPSPQSQAMMSIRLPTLLHTHTTYCPSHFLPPSIVSIDHVRDKQRTG